MAIDTSLVRIPPRDVLYAESIGAPNVPFQRAANTLMSSWYQTRAVVWQLRETDTYTATVTPWRWRMHTPAGLVNFALLVRGGTSATTATVELLRDGSAVATVTLTTTTQVLSDLTGSVGTEGDHTWQIRITPSSNTVTITDIWVVWADITTP